MIRGTKSNDRQNREMADLSHPIEQSCPLAGFVWMATMALLAAAAFHSTALAASRIQGQASRDAPEVAVFGGRLHMLHLGGSGGSKSIYHTTFDGRNWTNNVLIEGQKSKVTPALAAVLGRLHMVTLREDKNKSGLWHSTFNGRSWTGPVRIGRLTSLDTPALAAVGNQLVMVKPTSNSNQLTQYVYNGSTFESRGAISGANTATTSAPSMAFFDGRIQIVFRGPPTWCS